MSRQNYHIVANGAIVSDENPLPIRVPAASATVPGVVKIGDGLTISPDGTLSADAGIPEAPEDGIIYGRKDGEWVPIETDLPLVRLTPAMTSNTTPSPFIVTYSSRYGGDQSAWDAFNAFDQIYSNEHGGTAWYSKLNFVGDGNFSDDGEGNFFESGVGDEHVTIYLGGIARTLKKVILRTRAGEYLGQARPLQQPRDYTIEGSTDGVNFFVIETITDAPMQTESDYLVFGDHDIQPIAIINYLRIHVTKIWGVEDGPQCAIGEIEAYGY